SMPMNAAQIAGADHVVPLADLASLLTTLVQEPGTSERGGDVMDPMEKMTDIVDRDMDRQVRGERRGDVSVFTCPECGGSPWRVGESGGVPFRFPRRHAHYSAGRLPRPPH